jgi:SAM-dependent methyltransferase
MRLLSRILRRVIHGGHPIPEPGQERNASWYDAVFASSENYRGPYWRSHYYFLWTVIADRIRRAGLHRVLEIGCGPGQLATLLTEQGVQEYTGLDFSAEATALAAMNVPMGRIITGDARDPAVYREVAHDVIICTEVLEHIEDDLHVISMFPAGTRCFCSVPNFPDGGHVRFFADADEVASRYGPYFRDLDVLSFRSPLSESDRFFLLDGVRNNIVTEGASTTDNTGERDQQ